MDTFNTINRIITLLIFVYALYILPKAIGEIKGVYMEKPDEFFGKFEQDCKWTHGTTYGLGALSYVLIVVILFIWNQISNSLGIVVANVILLIFLLISKYYYDKQKIINATEAYQKNIEDGYIKETEPMPNFEGRLTKLFKKIFKKE